MRTADQPEPFQPLGRPIRDEHAPEPTPVPVAPGIVRDPDGTLRTIIPPPSAPAPALRPMQTRDAPPKLDLSDVCWSVEEMAAASCAKPYEFNRINVDSAIARARKEWNEARNIAATRIMQMMADLSADGDVTYTSNIPRHERTGS